MVVGKQGIQCVMIVGGEGSGCFFRYGLHMGHFFIGKKVLLTYVYCNNLRLSMCNITF